MTDKEQIMIDGVDVSGCEYACNTAFGKNGCKHHMMKNIYCSKNPNCYFKQLARKTQECEKYKQTLDEIKEYTRKQFCDNCEDIGSTEYSCHCEYCEYQEYLDIISKAKDINAPHKKDGE